MLIFAVYSREGFKLDIELDSSQPWMWILTTFALYVELWMYDGCAVINGGSGIRTPNPLPAESVPPKSAHWSDRMFNGIIVDFDQELP
jgi:hypothetical protein